jgi:peptidoglycan/LPS O-acetylase OafA/YrhL
MGLLWVDFLGPQYDFVAKLQKIVPSGYMNQTLVLGVACMLILATVKNVKPVAWILEMPLFRLFGAVSFSLYVTHPYFILANFPAMQNLVLGSQQPFQHLQLHVMPWWYMPLVFLPGAVFFALIAHLLVEHPGIRLGRMLIRSWEQTPVSAKMRTAATNSTSDKWSGSGLERVKELR